MNSLRKLRDNIKRSKLCVLGVPEEEARRRDGHLKEEHLYNGILSSAKKKGATKP